MRKTLIILGFALLVLTAFAAWQVAACYVANAELQSDMNDLAVQNSARIGLSQIDNEEELRDAVVSRAKDDGIQLEREQVTVQRTLTSKMLGIALKADYAARVNLLFFSFIIRFAPSSSHSGEIVVK
jgi:hypothetical protein